MPIDMIRLFLVFLVQFPIGWTMHFCIRGKYLRHLYTCVIGMALQLYVYRDQVKHIWIMATVAYLLMNVLPRQK